MSTPRAMTLPPGTTARRFTTSRGEIAALVATPTDAQHASGPRRLPAVLVPGFTGSKEDFLAVLAPLAASGRTIAAIDQRGQHESPGSPDREAYALEQLARDVLDVVDALGGRAHLVGHSFGGHVTRTASLVAGPEVVASHTLVGSGPGVVTGARTLAELALLLDALQVHDMETIWEAKRAYERGLGAVDPPPEVEAFLHQRFVGTDPLQLIVAGEHLLDEVDRTDVLVEAAVPLLVVSGAAEDVWSADALGAMATAAGARLVVVGGAGHSPAVDDPAATAAALLELWDEVEHLP